MTVEQTQQTQQTAPPATGIQATDPTVTSTVDGEHDTEVGERTFTQEQVNKIVSKTKRAEARKYQQAANATPPASSQTATPTLPEIPGFSPEQVAALSAFFGKTGAATAPAQAVQPSTQVATGASFKTALKSTAKAEAKALGVQAQYIPDLLKLADLSDVEPDDDGDFDDVEIQRALKKVIKKHPSWATASTPPPVVKAGVASQGAGALDPVQAALDARINGK